MEKKINIKNTNLQGNFLLTQQLSSTDRIDKTKRIDLKDCIGDIKSVKFKKNYVLTHEKINNFKIKFVEKQFKIIHSKDTPSEYLRLVFKILKQKEKQYVKKRQDIEKTKYINTDSDAILDKIHGFKQKGFFPDLRKLTFYNTHTTLFTEDEFDFEHKIDYIDSQYLDDEQKLKDSMIYNKLETKYKFFDQIKSKKSLLNGKSCVKFSESRNKRDYLTNNKFMSEIDTNILPNLVELKRYTINQHLDKDRNNKKAEKILKRLNLPENQKVRHISQLKSFTYKNHPS